jgi:hypothetical protein
VQSHVSGSFFLSSSSSSRDSNFHFDFRVVTRNGV